jgi:hypothetical protein
VRRFLPLGLALLAGFGGSGDTVVAHVGGEPVGRDQLDAVVAHFRKVGHYGANCAQVSARPYGLGVA